MKRKIIIDTDPGVDDILALLLALSSPELEVVAITTVHGNIDLINSTSNAISLFNVLQYTHDERRRDWISRLFQEKKIRLSAGERAPLVPEKALDASYFHGFDGLGNVSKKYPQFLPKGSWQSAFPAFTTDVRATELNPIIDPSPSLACDEILSILKQHDHNEITIVALGPLTNLSKCCKMDYDTFCKAKEIVIMGGALECPGNVTPVAEFNFLGDPEAAAHVLSFTSPTPSSTCAMGPARVKEKLNITLLPLDTTTEVCFSYSAWQEIRDQTPLKDPQGSGIVEWTNHFLESTFKTMHNLYSELNIEKVNLSAHDPSCIWYLLNSSSTLSTGWVIERNEDLRIECDGRWTRGSCVVDRRHRQKIAEGEMDTGSDHDSWLSSKTGNRVSWVKKTPGSTAFVRDFGSRVFGSLDHE